MHAFARFAAGVLLAAACNTQKSQPGGQAASDPSAAGSSVASAPAEPAAGGSSAPAEPPLARVRRWAPAVHTVAPADIIIPGLDLFMVSPPIAAIPPDGVRPYVIVGVTGGPGGKLVEDSAELIRAAIAATQDAPTLARLAMLVHHRAGELLLEATTGEQRKAKVTAPAATESAVDFWIWTTGVGRMLLRLRLDLATGALDAVQPGASPAAAAMAAAIAALAGTSASMHAAALKTLGGACAADPKARQALLGALAGHARDDARAAAAAAAPACGAAAVDPLIRAMEQDKAPTVRWKAAAALGVLGNVRARPALEKAARSDSPELQHAAKQALARLK